MSSSYQDYNVIFDINIYISSYISDNLDLESYKSLKTKILDKVWGDEHSTVFISDFMLDTFKHVLQTKFKISPVTTEELVEYILTSIVDENSGNPSYSMPRLSKDREDAKIIDLAIYIYNENGNQTYIVTENIKDFKEVQNSYSSSQISIITPRDFINILPR